MRITYTVNGKRVFGNGRKITNVLHPNAIVGGGVVMGYTTGGRPFIIGCQHFCRAGLSVKAGDMLKAA